MAPLGLFFNYLIILYHGKKEKRSIGGRPSTSSGSRA
jgi:hypothetical protein